MAKKGEWLILQNPDWHRLISQTITNEWGTASNDERLIILTQTRKKNPSEALKMVKEAWSQESMNQRIKFIRILENHLDYDLEFFLESLLDDRRKEIRRVATQALARIPGSALSQRLFERVKNLMTVKKRTLKKDKLSIQLPEKLDDSMIRDGIDPRVQWFKGGVKASRLGQMIALIPPSLWIKHFNMNAKEILELFVRSDWGELLVQAMVEFPHIYTKK